MKHIATVIALLATVFGLSACQHEASAPATHERTIVYTVSGQATPSGQEASTTVRLGTEAEWQALLGRFLDYAAEGSTVTFYNPNRATTKGTKDVATYSTTSRDEMQQWMSRMEDEGRTVTVSYDPETGTWTGTAYAVVSYATSGCITYTDVYNNGIVFTLDTVNHLAYFTATTRPVHFPNGVFDYYVDGSSIMMHEHYSVTSGYIHVLDITRLEGDTLEVDYGYPGMCTADHIHYTRLVPYDSYTLLHCHNEAADITLHIDRTGGNSGTGMAFEQYVDRAVLDDEERAFFTGFFQFGVNNSLDSDYPILQLSFNGHPGMTKNFYIEYFADGHESWHRWGDMQPAVAYDPLRDYYFERVR